MITFLYDVVVDLIQPVRAKPGDRLVVRPGHARPIVVVRKVNGKWTPVRIGPPNFGALILQEDDGTITLRQPAYIDLRQLIARLPA